MEHVQSELRSLLLEHFHIVPITTNRQDQWYKRSYQSIDWSKGKPLIVAPKHSREEWAPKVIQFAKLFANALRAEVNSPAFKRHYNHVTSLPQDNKLFPDNVIDEAYTNPLCGAFVARWYPYADTKPQVVVPAMQKLSYWTAETDPRDSTDPSCSRRNRIKALIACGQTEPLLRLATWRKTRPQEERARLHQPRGWETRNNRWWWNRWGDIPEDTIAVLLFLALLDAFPEEMASNEGYTRWAPYAFERNSSPFEKFIYARGNELPTTKKAIHKEQTRCLEALRAAEAWSEAGGFESLRWETHIIEAFLLILGFEAWNRTREGEGYLQCELNVAKHEGWLRKMAGEGHEDIEGDFNNTPAKSYYPSSKSSKLSKPVDPLRLREPRAEPEPELDEEEQQKLEALTTLESAEVDYGLKRSFKYAPRRRD